MSKDPAVLFYPQDFLVGVEFFTNEEVGAYIRVLCHQADKWSLTEKQIKAISGNSFDTIIEKFIQDEDGSYYNKKMREVQIKRIQYSAIQAKRIQDYWDKKKNDAGEIPRNNGGISVDIPLENGNENENEDINKDKELEEAFDKFRKKYPGTKRGLNTEFNYLKQVCKKNKLKISEIISLLNPAIDKQIKDKEHLVKNNLFCAEWRNLKTWLYNQCWDEEIGKGIVQVSNRKTFTFDEISDWTKAGLIEWSDVHNPGKKDGTPWEFKNQEAYEKMKGVGFKVRKF